MIHPSYTELMEVINSDVEPGEQPVVQSRYCVVLATEQIATNIIDWAEALESHFLPQSRSCIAEKLRLSEMTSKDTRKVQKGCRTNAVALFTFHFYSFREDSV